MIPAIGHNSGKVYWRPQPGSQQAFLSCPIFEALYEGTRGPGKTDALLMDFAQHVGQGFGVHWRGVLFRQTYPQLSDAIAKSKKWFHRLWPGAMYNEAKSTWKWPTGEELLLRHFPKPDSYWDYHGHEYPWIAWEELTSWADDQCFKVMMSCSRSPRPGIPRKYRATTNPYGVGHNWVKARYRLPGMSGRVIREPGEPPRVAIHGNLSENKILLSADPEYMQKVLAAARNPSEKAAWSDGDWDVIAGGMFDDVYKPAVHLVKPFRIPRNWIVDRSFDWGSSRPFSVGWWAESDGTDIERPDGGILKTVRGDLFRIAEWYGWDGTPNQGLRMLATEVADGIIEREKMLDIAGRVTSGPADTSIFDDENGVNIARDMQKRGVKWERADKGPGSRKQGWEQTRKRLKNAEPKSPGLPREEPGLFIFSTCEQWRRTVPTLPRDDKDLDDVDTEAEDHIGDEMRYRVRYKRKVLGSGAA